MYKITDKHDKTIHEMEEVQFREFLFSEIGIENAYEMSIEEVEEVLHSQGYSLERLH